MRAYRYYVYLRMVKFFDGGLNFYFFKELENLFLSGRSNRVDKFWSKCLRFILVEGGFG